MKQTLIANKSGLWFLFLKRLYEIDYSKNYIPYNIATEKICRNFSVNKKTFFELLAFCKEFSLVKLSCGHGILLLYKIEGDKLILKDGKQ